MEMAKELLDILKKIEKASPKIKNDKYFFYNTDEPEKKYLFVNWYLYNIIIECLYSDHKNFPDPSITIGSMKTGAIIKTIPLLKGNPFILIDYLYP